MKVRVIAILLFILFIQINCVFVFNETTNELNKKQFTNETNVSKEMEINSSKSLILIDFMSSAIGKAKWNLLALRMTKVFVSFFLDLALAEFFGTFGR